MQVGDWVIFDMSVGQIKELGDDRSASFSDGYFSTYGKLVDRFRPLTMANKCRAETAKYYYEKLREIDGEAGFNYPDISSYFSQLVLRAIDENSDDPFELAVQFVRDAREYKPVIQGVNLFRRKLRRA